MQTNINIHHAKHVRAEIHRPDDGEPRFAVIEINGGDGSRVDLYLKGAEGAQLARKLQAALTTSIAFLESDNV